MRDEKVKINHGNSYDLSSLDSQKWLFLYSSLTLDQKNELESSILMKYSTKFRSKTEDSNLLTDKSSTDYWKRIVFELQSRFTLVNVNLIWNKLGHSIKLRIRIHDTDVYGTEDGYFDRVMKLKSMHQFRINAYDRSILVRDGGVNTAYTSALKLRNDVFKILDVFPPSDEPTLFKSSDKLSNTTVRRSNDFISILTRYLGVNTLRTRSSFITVDINDQFVPLYNLAPIKKKRPPTKAEGNTEVDLRKKHIKTPFTYTRKRWNLERLRKVIISKPEPPPINAVFKKSFLNLPTEDVDVVVVGAGISGLAAANYLRACGVSVCVIEGRNRIGGRAFTTKLPKRELPDGTILDEVTLDLGASYLHCCSIVDVNNEEAIYMFDPAKDTRNRRSESKSLLGLAKLLKPRVSDVAGGANWESTVYTHWYNDMTGEKINLHSVVKANMLTEKIRLRAAKKAYAIRKQIKTDMNKESLMNSYYKYDDTPTSNKWYITEGLYKEFCNPRIKGAENGKSILNPNGDRKSLWDIYLESAHEIFKELNISTKRISILEWKLLFVIMQSRLGYNSDLRETCVSMCRLPTLDEALDSSVSYLNKNNITNYEHYVVSTRDLLSKANIVPFNEKTDSDKLVVDGWDWLLSYLSNGLEDCIHLGTRVTEIKVDESNCIYVKTLNSTRENTSDDDAVRYVKSKYAIVTVPNVLLSSERSYNPRLAKNKIHFIPPLDKSKCKALQRYRMGHHNKVLLRFDPNKVFWPTNVLQFNCLDSSFQFMNLHSYGKRGCILAHSFPPFSVKWSGIDRDEIIVKICLDLLQKMFSIPSDKMPYPIDAIVTRWYDDPFSYGSYSYPSVEAVDEDIIHLKSPHPKNNPCILFAGEYLSNSYYQCVDGAFDTGIRAAEDLAHIALNKPYPFNIDQNTPSLDGLLNPLHSEKYLNVPIPLPDLQHLGYYLTDGSDEMLTDTRFNNIIVSNSNDEDNAIGGGSNLGKELHLLEKIQSLVSSDIINVDKFKSSMDDIEVEIDLLKKRNYYNKDINTARVLLQSMWKSAQEFRKEVGKDEFNVRNQLFSKKLCQTVMDAIGIRHELVCWLCFRGGEVLLCDSNDCNKVWHLECLPKKNKSQLNHNAWLCPICVGQHVRRGDSAAEEAVQLYWLRRGGWWRVKAVMSLCRRVYERIEYCKKKLHALK